MQQNYEMIDCPSCGATIPVSPDMPTVSCGFCGNEYDVIDHRGDHQAADHQIGAWPAFFIGGVLGLGLGAVVFTATGRSMAAHAIAKGGNLAEKTVNNWLNAGEQKK